MSDFNTFNAEQDLDDLYNNDIHIHIQMRGRKCNTIIQGLEFSTKEENKIFLSKTTKKFGIGGCQKVLEDIDKNSMVFIFTGDCREKIKTLLIEEYNKYEDSIKIHG